jgi:pyridinium-3,5-biscarboxylic acid mononucleotide sulfurtransferase
MQQRLEQIIKKSGAATVAVSGGVDSMTLAYAVNRVLGQSAKMIHAISPAVPKMATSRVKEYAELYGWQLRLIDAGEFTDAQYRNNPVNRCFFCKSHLYETLFNIGAGKLMSGTNLDDLSDWRPGLKAAEKYEVRHPFIEAAMTKSDVRLLANQYGLSYISALPASPCLSSRIETGIYINAETLVFVDKVERLVRKGLKPKTVRCRIRQNEIVIALDENALRDLTKKRTIQLTMEVERLNKGLIKKPVRFGAYKQGQAFLRQ